MFFSSMFLGWYVFVVMLFKRSLDILYHTFLDIPLVLWLVFVLVFAGSDKTSAHIRVRFHAATIHSRPLQRVA
jgi:membrane protein required for beta-lactamase induction